MKIISRPMTIIPSFRGEPVINGTFVFDGPKRTCDACGSQTGTYAETREEGAPWGMVTCAADLFASAEVDGAKVQIS